MNDTVIIDGHEYSVTKTELHLPTQNDSAMIYLAVRFGVDGGFDLWDVELACLDKIEELDGQRLHVKPDGETYDDDTLGTDILGSDAFTDRNFLSSAQGDYCYGDILIDFHRHTGSTYHLHCEFTLTESDENPDDLLPEDFSLTATADFSVVLDQEDPME